MSLSRAKNIFMPANINSIVILELQSYAHLFDTCQQNWFAVSSIIENTLKVIKTQKPHITQVYLRSDEAGCYHNNALIAAAKDIGQRVGIGICHYDYSEPQYGKDVCDRILCPMKTYVSDDTATKDMIFYVQKI